MLWFAINSYPGWRRDYAHFEAAIALKGLKTNRVNENMAEISIAVIIHSDDQRRVIIEAAEKCFGKSFHGLLP
jgi:hypothetical protein